MTTEVSVRWGGSVWPRVTIFNVRWKREPSYFDLSMLDTYVHMYFGPGQGSRRYITK